MEPHKLHEKFKGKIEIMAKVPVGKEWYSIWYTPGVAEAVKEISKNKEMSFEMTWRGNAVAVVSDGTRVLGLGDVGPEAALPVMEGKALLFKALGGIDAVPLVHRSRELNPFLTFLKSIEPSFGGINLEDIESPKCFELLERARRVLEIPVWHDDQQGTAMVTLAGLINATYILGKELRKVKIVLFGAGAANIALFNLLRKYGVSEKNIVVIDSRGPLNKDREDLEEMKVKNKWKYEIATKAMQVKNLKEAFEGAEVLIAASRPGPNVIKKEWIRLMHEPIVFAEANPVPEIMPKDAKEAGAKIVATGRSDFPNQVNNSLAFPSVFRGVLDVRAKKINDEMIIAGAEELAKVAREDPNFGPERILPTMDDIEVFPRVAARVAHEASRLGIARKPLTYEEEYENAKRIIEAFWEKYAKLRDIIFALIGG